MFKFYTYVFMIIRQKLKKKNIHKNHIQQNAINIIITANLQNGYIKIIENTEYNIFKIHNYKECKTNIKYQITVNANHNHKNI